MASLVAKPRGVADIRTSGPYFMYATACWSNNKCEMGCLLGHMLD